MWQWNSWVAGAEKKLDAEEPHKWASTFKTAIPESGYEKSAFPVHSLPLNILDLIWKYSWNLTAPQSVSYNPQPFIFSHIVILKSFFPLNVIFHGPSVTHLPCTQCNPLCTLFLGNPKLYPCSAHMLITSYVYKYAQLQLLKTFCFKFTPVPMYKPKTS